MTLEVLIAGGGIGGLAAALAASRAGWDVRVLERAASFSEVGAGVQLGPNAVRVLEGWGLLDALRRVAAFPDRLEVRCAINGRVLGVLPLGDAMVQRYGAPYATVHRADLHGVLLQAVQQTPTRLHAGRALAGFSQTAQAVTVQCESGFEVECDALVGADGLWSAVRQQLLGDGLPQRSGHLAYRALVAQNTLPERLRSQCVTAWLGPHMHVVQYPVRSGEFLNIVAFIEGKAPESMDTWDHSANASDLAAGLADMSAPLQDLLHAVGHWRLWVMSDRPPMQGAHQHAVGRVALLGDAAHPMRPYLAQGAGMALEDAAELGRALSIANDPAFDVPVVLQRFALNRWQRNARVQARALRNGQIFHADGVMRRARDASLRLLGERLLDMPWLYGDRQGTSNQ
ncbi:FAD-dependent monooxygenase [Polaromonas sp. YR568]|uniref:FAD-dependent monooxygenase n=1 Tax=Polaromonas sp. YR568 TaxID=1855301 RepID=UPI00313793CD